MQKQQQSILAWLPILSCVISCNGNSGFVETAPPAKRWHGPTLIENQDGLAGGAKAAISRDGLGFAVWTTASANVPFARRLYASRELSDGVWSDPVIIDDSDGDPFSPLLAVRPNGDAVVVWTEVESGGGQHIYANTFDGQRGWAGPVQLSIHNHQERPYMAANSQGNAIVVWEASDLFGTSIVTNRFDAGIGWSGSEIIDPVLISSSYPHVAINADGNAIAAWTDDFDQDEAHASLFLPDSGWTQAETLSGPQDGVSISAVAVDSAGEFVVIWSQFEGSAFYRLVSRQYSAVDGWSEPETIGFDDGQAGISDVATDGQGVVISARNSC